MLRNSAEVRQFTCDGKYPHPNGRSYTNVTCPFCDWETRAYLWSLAGSGKKCANPNCGAVHASGAQSYRDVTSQED